MANYSKATNFTVKDTLLTGNANKVVRGSEIDNEFIAIAAAVASKADINSPTFTGVPAAPTATAGTNTTQLASTAFVKTALDGLGTMSTQNATAVAITGGTITGITDLAVADGGTGSSTLSANAVLLGNGTSALQTVAPGNSGNILISNGTTWVATASGSAVSGTSGQAFTSNGTFTIPTGIAALKVTVIGGGGGGGGAYQLSASGGGGAGGTAIKYLTGLTAGNTLAVTVGAAGAAVAAGTYTDGGNGGNSTVASGTQTITTVTGGGGTGGKGTGTNQGSISAGGAGGTATNGTINVNGTSGTPGSIFYFTNSGDFTGCGGTGGGSSLGGGGRCSVVFSTGTAVDLSSPGSTGGGGSGGAWSASGAGGAGIVIFEW